MRRGRLVDTRERNPGDRGVLVGGIQGGLVGEVCSVVVLKKLELLTYHLERRFSNFSPSSTVCVTRGVFRCGSAESITRIFYSGVQGLIFTKSHLKARLNANAAGYDPTTRRFLVHRTDPTRRREDESRDCWTGSRSRFSSSRATRACRVSDVEMGRGEVGASRAARARAMIGTRRGAARARHPRGVRRQVPHAGGWPLSSGLCCTGSEEQYVQVE